MFVSLFLSMINNTALASTSAVTLDSVTASAVTLNMTTPSVAGSCDAMPHSGGETHQGGTFVWSKNIQGWVLSAYFYGYISSQVFFLWYILSIESCPY
jgi:hypothetical protein